MGSLVVQTNIADAQPSTLWLVEHERDDPMVLTQREYTREDATSMLAHMLKQHVASGLRVDPPFAKLEIGRRYDVHDASGWVATYWLSEEKLARDDGMLTAIVSPGAKQRGHHIEPAKQH